MKPGTAKSIFLPLEAFLLVALFWACSLNIEATNPYPQENPSATTPDSVKTPSPVVTSDTSTPGSSTPDTSALDKLPSDVDSLNKVPQETTFAKDTIVIRDTLVIYKDTIYDTLYDTTSYNSFVYRKNSNGKLDTVTGWSRLLNCDIGDTAFSCTRKPNYAGVLPLCGLTMTFTKRDDAEYELVKLDTNVVYVQVHDTLYKDAFHVQQKECVNDTSFINYGESRVMDYIPPERVYIAPADPFDSTEMRSLLDTLDFSAGDEAKIEIKAYSYLQFDGLPLRAVEMAPMDTFVTAIGSELKWYHWPDSIRIVESIYYISNTDLESDTTVAWTLKYTRYEPERSETDSIQVTSFIKVK